MAKAPSTVELVEIAKRLLDAWSGEIGGSGIDEIDIVSALKKLLVNDFLGGDIFKPENTGDLIDLIQKGVKLFQRNVDDGVPASGILTSATLKRINELRGVCDSKVEKPPLPASVVADVTRNGNVPILVCCFVSSRVPNQIAGKNVKHVLANAWDAWLHHIDMSMVYVNDEASCNVVVEWGAIDRRAGGILAEAHLGGPERMKSNRLRLTFDQEEDFTTNEKKFRGTASHEIGHLLGLEHVSGPGQLMSAFFNPAILEPTPNDIARAQAIWGR